MIRVLNTREFTKPDQSFQCPLLLYSDLYRIYKHFIISTRFISIYYFLTVISYKFGPKTLSEAVKWREPTEPF